MTWCLAYATSGQEFTVSAALTARGIEHRCPTVTVKRTQVIRGRPPKIVTEKQPAIPNYLFLMLPAEEWNDVATRPIKHLRPTMQWLNRADVAGMDKFCEQIEAMEVLHEYNPGDQIRQLTGPFSDTVLTFRKLVEAETKIQAEAEMFGHTVKVTLDPENVRRA